MNADEELQRASRFVALPGFRSFLTLPGFLFAFICVHLRFPLLSSLIPHPFFRWLAPGTIDPIIGKVIPGPGKDQAMQEQSSPPSPIYRRVILKLSGEAFGFPGKPGISIDETKNIARQVSRAAQTGVQLAVVVGGGNILRGAQLSRDNEVIKPSTAHYMGMLATILNGLALQEALESLGCETRLQTAIRMETVAEPYIRRRCVRHLEKNRIVILAGGTGNPFVTTDSAAALRARELEADVLLKATKVDGVYSDDPEVNPHAVRYDKLTYDRLIHNNLRVMDLGAVSLCREGRLPILVFNYKREGYIERAIAGHPVGTLVSSDAAETPAR
jgi:uridylate kinase